MKKLIALLMAVSLTLGLCACGLDTNGLITNFENFKKTLHGEEIVVEEQTENSATLRIGVFEPITGKYAGEAGDEVKGIELARRLFSSVLGTRIELVYADNQSDPELCEEAVQSLIDAGCVAIIGSYSNLLSLAVCDLVEDAQMPLVVPSCTNPLLTSTTEYVSRVCVVDSFEGVSVAKYLIEYLPDVMHPTIEDDPETEENEFVQGGDPIKAVVLKDSNNEKASALVERFQAKMTEVYGAEGYAKVVEYKNDAESFLPYLIRLQDLGAEAVFFPSSADKAEKVLYEAYENGLEFQWVGDSSWVKLREAAEEAGRTTFDHLEKVAFVSDYDGSIVGENTIATDFKAAAKTYYRESEPSQGMALGYDAYLLVISAVREAGLDCTPQELQYALSRIRELQCVTGSITYLGGNGDPVKDVVIEKIVNGKIVGEYAATPNFNVQ